jgi:hypothetical protein
MERLQVTAARQARLLFDADMRAAIVHGLRRALPGGDFVWAREIGMARTPDPELLEWAAARRRAVVSHDVRSMIRFANVRLRAGLPIPGLVVVPQLFPTGQAVGDLSRLVAASVDEPLDGRISYVPLDKSWRVSEDAPDWAEASA